MCASLTLSNRSTEASSSGQHTKRHSIFLNLAPPFRSIYRHITKGSAELHRIWKTRQKRRRLMNTNRTERGASFINPSSCRLSYTFRSLTNTTFVSRGFYCLTVPFIKGQEADWSLENKKKVFSQLLHVACIIDGLSLIHCEYMYSHIMTQSMFSGVIHTVDCYDVNLCVNACFCAYAHEACSR